MSRYTYESEDKVTPLETYEWDNTWLEHTEKTDTPRVLYIGDSISCATRGAVNNLADGKLLFDGFGTSKALDNPYLLDEIALFARQEGKRAAILFNNGLHGWHLSDDEEYAAAYERTVLFLLDEFKGTPLYLVLTTQVGHESRIPRVIARNAAACRIAEKYGLPVIDLYELSLKHANHLSGDLVHFKPEGYPFFAEAILDALKPLID